MRVNIPNKRESYEVGDLIKLNSYGTFRMIIKIDKHYRLMTMSGRVTTREYDSIEELLDGRNITNHYKNKDLKFEISGMKNTKNNFKCISFDKGGYCVMTYKREAHTISKKLCNACMKYFNHCEVCSRNPHNMHEYSKEDYCKDCKNNKAKGE